MTLAAIHHDTPSDIRDLIDDAGLAMDRLLARAVSAVGARVTEQGRVVAAKVDEEQRAVHGLAWLATYVTSLNQLSTYLQRLENQEKLGRIEVLIALIGAGEYLSQIFGGIPMSQVETVRLDDLWILEDAIAAARTTAVRELIASGNTKAHRAELTEAMRAGISMATMGNAALDEDYDAIRDEMRRFCDAEVTPVAHQWHLDNAYIPMDVVEKMAELGVFGLTIPEEFGGLGLGKESMCVVSEELSRGYIGVGSLGTRSEIAAELILAGGTLEQKQSYLPRIASGEILPTAVFTEPNTGSDLASLRARAIRDGDTYVINGNKTWITHPVRADVMTLLARTNPDEAGYPGLSMFLAEKQRGTDEDPFPTPGMSGGEIEVLGYRGMKEYEIAFSDFTVPADALLGGVEGQGFKQLMQTFESARIQTAARAVGVAQSALDLGLRYGEDRVQFKRPIIAFPRVSDKLAMIAVETMIARQLTHFSAREKDSGRRCDLEAGMAKLLGARVAWAAADNVLQIHGGNGFAHEYPISRVLCDARILNIFEGAGEIQAQVIARRLLEKQN